MTSIYLIKNSLNRDKVIAKGFSSLVCNLNFIFNKVFILDFETFLTDSIILMKFWYFCYQDENVLR